ncbi:MAG: transposase, partial [Bacteriovoracia bacterium]
VESDEHKLYPGIVQKYLPKAVHKRYKGGRGCIAGQGELKKLHYDPLFAINHTCAMLRDNIKRLTRKTWCTTKSVEMLQKHFDIFVYYFNTQILK